MNPLTILLVDDSEIDRAIYRRFLNQSGQTYQFVEFGLAEAALSWYQTHTPDLILLDYRLPDLDGLEFLSALQKQTKKLEFPLILLTGYGNTEIAVKAMKQGAQDYLDKDRCTAAELQIRVQGVLEKSRLKQTLHCSAKWQNTWEFTIAMRTSISCHQGTRGCFTSNLSFLRILPSCRRSGFYPYIKCHSCVRKEASSRFCNRFLQNTEGLPRNWNS